MSSNLQNVSSTPYQQENDGGASEVLNALILSYASHSNPLQAVQLLRNAGSATAVIDNRRNLRDFCSGCSQRMIDILNDIESAMRRAEQELEYAVRNDIRILRLGAADYPSRLSQCEDAPVTLFFKGTADLNCRHVISVVGTRRCTPYGQDCVRRFVKELAEMCPDVLVVSGLAYGIDICSHRAALDSGVNTVGVLAHGLDYLYPTAHKDTARQMLTQGGLLTEFFTQTNADKLNFLRRNRIVAGVADAVIVAESASHGGALVTSRIANSYSRDVFAFPGRVGDPYSEGCNNLIRDNKAALVTSATDFMAAMGWQTADKEAAIRRHGIERTLFPDLTTEEQLIVSMLQKDNDQQLNTLTVRANLPVSRLTAILFQLEMKGVIRCLAGVVYHLNG